MVFTVQKLHHNLSALHRAAEGPAHQLRPVYSSLATGPMAMPAEGAAWQQLEVGQQWGVHHGTQWLMAHVQATEKTRSQPLVLQLHWDTPGENDPLFLRLEATVFLDGQAIGAFDWRHPVLLLPSKTSDGQQHTLHIQVYTGVPQRFGGLTLRVRHTQLWQLYHQMETTLDVLLTMREEDPERHALLAHLNTAYNMFDLREGWHSERFAASAQDAQDYLQTHLTEGLISGNRPQITVSGHAHLDVGWQWPYWRTRQKIAHTVANVLSLMER